MEIFDIRFSKVTFQLAVVEDTELPRDKVSALRGGMGEMMLRLNCVRNRACEECDFASECLVQRIMYAKSKIRPVSVTEGESMGYVLNCDNHEEVFFAGDTLELELTLFGNNIVYFQQYLQALAMLGNVGIGKNKSRFAIIGILNSRHEPILEGNNILMEKYAVERLGDYVEHRLRRQKKSENPVVVLQSPLTMKYQGVFLKELSMEALYSAIARRIYMLDCFEGIQFDDQIKNIVLPYRIGQQNIHMQDVKRFSNHKQQKMILHGMVGKAMLEPTGEDADEELFWKVLYAGEILHIGKNTSFGFGKYRVR